MSFSDLVKRNLEKLESTFDESLSGVHIYNEKKVCKCDRLFDGTLIDWKGRIKQQFSFSYLSVFCQKGYLAQKTYESKEFGLWTKKDKKIWTKNIPIHHEIYPLQKSFFTFTKEVHKYKGRDVAFDVILEFDYVGTQQQRWSSWDHLQELQKCHKTFPLDYRFLPVAKRKNAEPFGSLYDYYRFNSFQQIPKNTLEQRDSRFQKGNWLVSARHGSLLFIIDYKTKKIVWSYTHKTIQGQHAAQLLENGNILLFDNGRYRGWSRIIELNPLSGEIVFEYRADSFYSQSRGYVQKLENGNYLITESERGRIFEITLEKELVWEYYHPQKQTDTTYPQSIGKREWIYRCYGYKRLDINNNL